MRLVGLANRETSALVRKEFYLYRHGVPDDCLLGDTKKEILGLLGISDLKEVSAVKCTIRNRVSRNTLSHYWAGREGKVFGVDVQISLTDGHPDKIYDDVFLLKVFSDEVGVVHTDDNGRDRLRRTQYLCEPANNLQLLARNFPYGANEDLFAGAPILAFPHHLGLEERRNKGEAFVCYIMKNAGVSRQAFAADSQISVRRWSELNDELLRPRHRIALALDLACAVQMLHDRHIQHCDLSPDNVLVIRSANPVLAPRLALIDFDSFYHPDVPALESHKRHLFDFGGVVVRPGAPSSALVGVFEDHARRLSPDTRLEESAEGYYVLRDSRPGRRSINYLIEGGKGTDYQVWLLGTPGHENYQSPLDLLSDAQTRERYDNFALGMLIFETLCRLDAGFDRALIDQASIDALNGATPPALSAFCGPARFILHQDIVDLLKRVFLRDCSEWPEPIEWITALKEGPVYRVCPGPMRTVWRGPRRWVDALKAGALGRVLARVCPGPMRAVWRKSFRWVDAWKTGVLSRVRLSRTPKAGMPPRLPQPCLWPLPHLNQGKKKLSWFRQVWPTQRLHWLEKIGPVEREELFAREGLTEEAEFCAVCGSSLRLDTPERR